jgi:hypothetical protein
LFNRRQRPQSHNTPRNWRDRYGSK